MPGALLQRRRGLSSIDFGHQPTGQTGGNRSVTVTNVATTATTVSMLAATGVNADQFAVVPGSTCTGASPRTQAAPGK
jgi:hypothetical protein